VAYTQLRSITNPSELEARCEDAELVDDVTKAAIEAAQESARRGELVTLEQSTINLRKRIQAWRKAKEEAALPV